ncbi:glycoside hydrolase family 13 protein [Rubrivirga litoralis]|uniref:Glycoside hydrolase family 13 protein n=1 Tax=Rubrivirga litoralis TaxID=3075598 RepID=A0ABU3BLU9_9BACT|nr:glycoside hydrolase family 13 protein [Rubrivirga sp. F394]MDT0630269.1 glycoside hydrolase family 13 protein [Rubrivirga sp. F394]
MHLLTPLTVRLRLALALLLLAPLGARAQAIDRVEPASWWVGMEHPELQVLVYGDDIGRARVEMDPYPGVRLDGATAVESPNYLFLALTVGEEARPGALTFRFRHPDGDLVRTYELKAREPMGPDGRGGAAGFTSADVIYLMMPDRFANGDVTNDSVAGLLEGADRSDPNARHGGDFAGVAERLGYLDALGLTALWFTPVFENDMTPEYGAYHGYAATDMYKVDPRFGTNEEFVDLVAAAHDRGLKVIMDMIHNHVGDRHWWMADPPTADWVHSYERYGQTNYAVATAVDPYASEVDHSGLVDGWFVAEMPDLNQDNELLAQYLLQNTVWWIETARIDGIRMDTYPFPDKDYMARWAEHVLAEYPDFNIVGEAWMYTVPHEAYWQRGFEAASGDGYDSHIPSVTDFPLMYAFRDAVAPENGEDGPERLYLTLSQDLLYPEPERLVTFLDNHDTVRFLSRVDEDDAALKMAYAVLMTTRGIPQVYYGTELGMANLDPALGDGSKRADMMGGWPGDERDAFTRAGRTDRENEILDYVTALTTWRRTADVVHHGQLTHFIPRDGVYVYVRHPAPDADGPGGADGGSVMVAVNAAAEARTLDLARFAERLDGYTTARDVVTGRSAPLGATLDVPARTALVLELSR